MRTLARCVQRHGGIQVYGLVEALPIVAGEPPAGQDWREVLGSLRRCGKGEGWELMLHAHLVVYLPGWTQDDVLALFRHHFDDHPEQVYLTPVEVVPTVGEDVAGVSAYATKLLRPLNTDPTKRLPLAAEVAARLIYCLPRGLEALRVEIEPPRPKRAKHGEAEADVHSNPPCRSDLARARVGCGGWDAADAEADATPEETLAAMVVEAAAEARVVPLAEPEDLGLAPTGGSGSGPLRHYRHRPLDASWMPAGALGGVRSAFGALWAAASSTLRGLWDGLCASLARGRRRLSRSFSGLAAASATAPYPDTS